EAVGRFAWNAPLWRSVRLSPEGVYLVGPDNARDLAATREHGHLFVWKRDEPKPTGRLTVPGPVIWMDFVAAEEVAALTFGPEAVLQIWKVATGELTKSIELPKNEFSLPTRDPLDPNGRADPNRKAYLPNPWAGAVSPGGRYVFLGGTNGIVTLSLAEGKTVGTLPLPSSFKAVARVGGTPPYAGRGEFRGLGFSADARKLWALVWNEQANVVTWSLETGRPLGAVVVGRPDVAWRYCGAPLAGSEPNTLLVPQQEFASFLTVPGLGGELKTGSLIDARTGAVLGDLEVLPVRWAGEGLLLALGDPANAKHLLPASVTGGRKAAIVVAAEKLILKRPPLPPNFRVAGVIDEVNAPPPQPRPDLQPADRAGLSPSTATPPTAWIAPPVPPAVAERLVGARHVPKTRPLIGGTHAAFLHSWPTLDGRVNGKPTLAQGIHWHRYDLRTGQATGPAVTLWPWATSPADGKSMKLEEEMVAAALSPDGERLALRDPADLARVDVWDAAGQRLLGMQPFGANTPIQWVGWSQSGRLLTLGDGKLTAWDVPAGKAVYEVAGGYRLPVAETRGRAWLAVTGEGHVDLVEADSGRCLGRVPLAGAELPDDLAALSISPDGKLLAYCGRRTDSSPAQLQPEMAGWLLTWDLATGKPHPPLEVLRLPGWEIVAFDSVRVLVGGALFDLRCGTSVAAYNCRFLADSADGRLWAIGIDPDDEGQRAQPIFDRAGRPSDPARQPKLALRAVELVAYDTGPTSPADLFTGATPITVEADLQNLEKSRELGQSEVALLQKNGFTVGKSQWRLRGDAEIFDSGSRFTNGVHLPAIRVHWRLTSPDGLEAWKNSRLLLWDEVLGKYGVSSEVVKKKGPLGEEEYILEKFDFQGRSPRQTIIDDLLEKSGHYSTIEGLPKLMGKFNGRYQSLPVLTEVRYLPMNP
ncbi:MAG TPA: hypothetical protein VFV87_05020, partial [Pirellulaceae bacterium]|nr:hypothetical protein [Pirellulaceae bacterium]